jgi:hypothetical protein
MAARQRSAHTMSYDVEVFSTEEPIAPPSQEGRGWQIAVDTIVWYCHKPCRYIFTSIPDRVGATPRGFRCGRLTSDIDGKAAGDRAWRVELTRLWLTVADLIQPFYAEIRIGECPTKSWWWNGIRSAMHFQPTFLGVCELALRRFRRAPPEIANGSRSEPVALVMAVTVPVAVGGCAVYTHASARAATSCGIGSLTIA